MHSDSREIMTVYEQMINESCKALTPDQIAKKAKPADNKIKDKITADNIDGDKTTKDIISKPPFTDQDPENIDQDGVDTKIKDRYVMKECTASIQGCIDRYNSKQLTYSKLIDGIANKLNINTPKCVDRLSESLSYVCDEGAHTCLANAHDVISQILPIIKENAVLDNQWVIEEVLVMDAEALEILFTQLYKKINNDKEIINNIDVGSLLQHLNGVIGVLRNRTGE